MSAQDLNSFDRSTSAVCSLLNFSKVEVNPKLVGERGEMLDRSPR